MSRPTLAIAAAHGLSLALFEGGRVLQHVEQPMARGQAEEIVPALRRMLGAAAAEVPPCGRIIVETGPGSFTGLRIGLAAASALGLAWGVPLVGVRSTQLVAAAARAQGQAGALVVALAAPRGQIWIEHFAAGSLTSTARPRALAQADAGQYLAGLGDDFAVVGSALGLLGRAGFDMVPHAAAAALVPEADLGDTTPLYVRIGDDGAAG